MAQSIHFNADQVARREYEALSPERYDFRWNRDYTEVTAVPLAWWDDASYARYQGDGEDDRPSAEDMAACEFIPAAAACDWPLIAGEVPF